MLNDSGFDSTDKGFFRGKEGKSLLILAGLLIVGWPAVFYFGSQKAPPAPPKPPPVAAIPPLPPPDPDPAFQGLRDKTHSSELDNPAKELAFKRIREIRPEDLDKMARRGVTPQELCQRPNRYRGLPIHLEGYAKYVAVDEEPGLTPSNRFYEVWISVEPDRLIPCCLAVEIVPKTLPAGRNLDERIVFDGYFLKLLAYRAVDVERFGPLLVGRLEYNSRARSEPEKRSIWWTIWPLGLIFGYLGMRIVFILKRNLFRRPEQPRRYFSDETSGTGSISEKAGHIEPDALNQWLADVPDDEDSADDDPV